MENLAKLKECPVCGATKPQFMSYPIKNWRSHIRKIAEREIFLKALMGDERKTPHFDFFKKNAVIVSTEQLTIKL